MIILEFKNMKNLNTSLQVGDAVYARNTNTQTGSNDAEAGFPAVSSGGQVLNYVTPTGASHFIGILRKIENLGEGTYHLHVEEKEGYRLSPNDFIMFSKFSYGDSGVVGYYAKVKLTNNSNRKAELFAVSSEVIINSN
tara:strand:- start:20 stop:433 length:414 start_codon:yes stop_codon:yes gene_type:complete